jgi:ribonucleoside-triphosphate reductase
MTRVTGFFSKVGSWNKGKLAELKDRNKNHGHFSWVEA